MSYWRACFYKKRILLLKVSFHLVPFSRWQLLSQSSWPLCFLPGQMIEVGANQLDFVGYKWDRETLLKLQSFHGKVLFLSTYLIPALYVASVREPSLLWNVFLPGRKFWSTCMRLAWSVAFWRISRKSWVTRLYPGRHRLLCWLLQLEEATPAEWVLELTRFTEHDLFFLPECWQVVLKLLEWDLLRGKC